MREVKVGAVTNLFHSRPLLRLHTINIWSILITGWIRIHLWRLDYILMRKSDLERRRVSTCLRRYWICNRWKKRKCVCVCVAMIIHFYFCLFVTRIDSRNWTPVDLVAKSIAPGSETDLGYYHYPWLVNTDIIRMSEWELRRAVWMMH